MGFFDSIQDETVEFKYECRHCGVTSIYEMPQKDQDYTSGKECFACMDIADYAGFLPRKVNLVTKTQFEQNGVYGYEIKSGNGRVQRMSKTRYDYLQSGGERVEHAYTEGRKEYLRKTGQGHMLEVSNPKKERQEAARAKVSAAREAG